MKSYFSILSTLICLLFTNSLSFAQSGVTAESSAGSFFGIGGRAVGMSEAVLVSGNDGTAIVYNPAGLVRIKRAELYGALSHEKVENETGRFTNDFTKTRFSSLNLTVPVPTYRGSLVVAFGVNRTKSFDRTFGFEIGEGNPPVHVEGAAEEANGDHKGVRV